MSTQQRNLKDAQHVLHGPPCPCDPVQALRTRPKPTDSLIINDVGKNSRHCVAGRSMALGSSAGSRVPSCMTGAVNAVLLACYGP
jgi:hypothetical protein